MKQHLRKVFLALLAGVLFNVSATAQESTATVGATDNSIGYLGAFSEILQLTSGQMATFEFTNFSSKEGNWNNWVSCVSGETFDAANLLVALRADNWENVQNANTGVTSNFNWDTFRDDMDGATIVTTFKYQEESVTIHCDITTAGGTSYFEEFTKTGVTGPITVAMSVDHSHMIISKSVITIGAEDNTTGYLGAFSSIFELSDNEMATFEFTNHSSKGGNWNNWVSCVSGETFDATNLLVALRADNWENVQVSNNGISSNFNWDIFMDEMDGASVVTTFKYQDGKVTIHCDITALSGNTYFEEFTKSGLSGTITVAMSVDGSHLDMKKAEKTSLAPKPEGLVGNEDNSINYMGDFSQTLQLTDGQMATFEFTNYSAKEANSQNWLACASKGETFSSVAEDLLVVLRADNWEIVQWANTGITSNYNWDIFKDEMDESSVVVTFKYQDGKVTIHADITAKSGNTYFEEFTKENVEGTISVCMSVEKAHLIVTKAEVSDIPVKAEGQVGETDNTTDRLGDTSEALTFEDGQMATFEFTNYSDKQENWHNWIACVASGEAIDTENPLVLLRADNYEEVQAANTGITSNYDWETFKDDMNESNVVLTIKYKNGRLIMRAKITTADEKEYFEEFVKGDVEGKVTAYMSVFLSHLIVTKAEVTDLPAIPDNYVGYEDDSSIYLEETSEVLTLTEGKIATFEFTNYSDKLASWHNWIVCIGGETFDLANLTVALRADKWENIQASNEGIESDIDFESDDLNEASVVVTVKYADGKAVITVAVTTKAGEERTITFTKEGLEGTITVAMSVDHAHLVVTKAEVTEDPASGISAIDTQSSTLNAPMYDLSGRRVDAQYKGIVIKNGKRMIVK